ncbi:MAG: hypothetical protein ACM3L9_02935 [Deltaproteobacteria bacterium]
MPIEAADIVALEALLEDQHALDGTVAPEDPLPEHPLARELGTILANPGVHRIGDLARIVDTLLKEMTMFNAGPVVSGETGT